MGDSEKEDRGRQNWMACKSKRQGSLLEEQRNNSFEVILGVWEAADPHLTVIEGKTKL